MNYELEIGAGGNRELHKLSRDVFVRVDKKIQKLKENPRPPGVIKLKGEGWRVRVGDWRIVYDIDDKAKKVWISRVRHRSEVYRKR